MYYAGIGSRKLPWDIQQLMTKISKELDTKGYILRSGGADGADTAFEEGSNNKEIFRPKDATPEAIKIASTIHPAWNNCNEYVRKLHGRNAQIILGRDLNQPVNFVICWTLNENSGGTSLGIKIAKKFNIPYFNLAKRKYTNLFDLIQFFDKH